MYYRQCMEAPSPVPSVESRLGKTLQQDASGLCLRRALESVPPGVTVTGVSDSIKKPDRPLSAGHGKAIHLSENFPWVAKNVPHEEIY